LPAPTEHSLEYSNPCTRLATSTSYLRSHTARAKLAVGISFASANGRPNLAFTRILNTLIAVRALRLPPLICARIRPARSLPRDHPCERQCAAQLSIHSNTKSVHAPCDFHLLAVLAYGPHDACHRNFLCEHQVSIQSNTKTYLRSHTARTKLAVGISFASANLAFTRIL